MSEIRKLRQNKNDQNGGGLKPLATDEVKKPTGGSDPVGQPGSATT